MNSALRRSSLICGNLLMQSDAEEAPLDDEFEREFVEDELEKEEVEAFAVAAALAAAFKCLVESSSIETGRSYQMKLATLSDCTTFHLSDLTAARTTSLPTLLLM